MSAIRWRLALPLVAVILGGCSNSSVDDMGNPGRDLSSGALASLAPTTTPTNQSKSDDGSEEAFIPPFPENVNFFSPPKIIAPVIPPEPEIVEEPVIEPEPEPVVEGKETPLPPLRLLGFIDVEELKALLSVDGQLSSVGVGDSRSGVELVSMDPPAITLKHGDNEFEISLFDQEWSDRAAATGPAFGPSSRTRAGRPKAPRMPPLPNRGARRSPSLPDTHNSKPRSPRLPISNRDTIGRPRPPRQPSNPQDPPDADIPDRPRLPGHGLPGLPGGVPGETAELE